MKRKGVVTALHRDPAGSEAPYIAASLITSPAEADWQPIQAAPLNGWPPPRSMCWFEDTGGGSNWLCVGNVGHRDEIVRDHFTISTAANLFGDTAWRQAGTLGTLAGIYTPGGLGVTRLTTTTTISQYLSLIKGDTSVVAIDALWFSARVSFPSAGNALASLLGAVGLASDDFTNFVTGAGAGDSGVFAFRQDGTAAGNWTLRTRAATVDVITDTGNSVALDTWYWLDIVHSAGAGWASMWVNGAGPTTVIGTSLPVPDAGYQPFATVHNLAAASRQMSVDFIGLEHFTAAVQP